MTVLFRQARRLALLAAFGAAASTAPAALAGPVTELSTDQYNESVVRYMYDQLMSRGDYQVVDTYFSPTFVDASNASATLDRAGFKMLVHTVRTAFPDVRATVVDAVDQGNRVAVRVTATGTNLGAFAGCPASGKQATWTETHIYYFANGYITGHLGTVDLAGLLGQICPAKEGAH